MGKSMFQGMEYVYEVYKERSFSKAAANLFISQPSLSANVKRVEQKIGSPIFDRSVKPLQLTECGRAYIRAVERIMGEEKEFMQYVNDLGNLKTGSLVLGGSNLFSSWILPALIAEFTAKYPDIRISLIEENTAELVKKLQKGHIDLILDNSRLSPDLFEHSIFKTEWLLLAVPKKFAVNQGLEAYQLSLDSIRSGAFHDKEVACVPLEAFRGQAFAMMKKENDTGERAKRICEKCHMDPLVVFEMDQQMTSYNITCSGLGISFVGDTLISRIPPNEEVVYYKLPAEDSVREICLYWKKGRYFTKAMEEFVTGIVCKEKVW